MSELYACFSCSEDVFGRVVRAHGSRDPQLFAALGPGSFRTHERTAFWALLRGGADASVEPAGPADLAWALGRILGELGEPLDEIYAVGGDAEALARELGERPPLSLLDRDAIEIVPGEQGCRLLAWSPAEVAQAVDATSAFVARCDARQLSSRARHVIDDHYRPALAGLQAAQDRARVFVAIPPHFNDPKAYRSELDDHVYPAGSLRPGEVWAYMTWTILPVEIDTASIAAAFPTHARGLYQTVPRRRALLQELHPSRVSDRARPLAVFRTPGRTWVSEPGASLLYEGISGAMQVLRKQFPAFAYFQSFDPGWYTAATVKDGVRQAEVRYEDDRKSELSDAAIEIDGRAHELASLDSFVAAICACAQVRSLADVFLDPAATAELVPLVPTPA